MTITKGAVRSFVITLSGLIAMFGLVKVIIAFPVVGAVLFSLTSFGVLWGLVHIFYIGER